MELYARAIRVNSRYFSAQRFRTWCSEAVGTRAAAIVVAQRVGVSTSLIRGLWAGHYEPGLDTYLRLCAAHELPLSAFLEHVETKPEHGSDRTVVRPLPPEARYFSHERFDAWCVSVFGESPSEPVLARHLGLSRNSVTRLRAGTQHPSLDTHLRMCARVIVPVREWLVGVQNPGMDSTTWT